MSGLGPRFNWRSPFTIGMTATGGAAVTVAIIVMLHRAGVGAGPDRGVALFMAIGMEPAVSAGASRVSPSVRRSPPCR